MFQAGKDVPTPSVQDADHCKDWIEIAGLYWSNYSLYLYNITFQTAGQRKLFIVGLVTR